MSIYHALQSLQNNTTHQVERLDVLLLTALGGEELVHSLTGGEGGEGGEGGWRDTLHSCSD